MEEKEKMNRIAYMISAYKDAPHLARLVTALAGKADFYVHVDRKADIRPFEEALGADVTFVRRHWTSWGGWSQVEYQKELLAAVCASGVEYDRVVCLSGQDYPLWSNERIHAYFAAHPDTEFIMGEDLTHSPNRGLQTRIRNYHFFRDLPWGNLWWKNKFIVAARYLMKWLPIRKPLTVNIDGREADVFCGSDYWALTMPCARYVYRMLSTQPALTRYFRHSFVPSEMCVQTIVFSSPFAPNVVPYDGRKGLFYLTPLHYLVYGKSIKVMTLADLAALKRFDRMFCRKVVSGVSDALVKVIDAARALPYEAEASSRSADASPQTDGSLSVLPHKTVSVVMCTYNGAKYLREQLDSILAQTRPADEIIVQDDRSTDGTYDILLEYARRYPFIHVYRNEVQKGINANFFSVMARATGDYIAISDQDDIWEPDKTERQLAAIGDCLLCAGQSRSFSTSDIPIETDMRLPNYSLLRLLYVAGFAGHTILMSRDMLKLIPDVQGICTCRLYDVILAMVAASYNSIAFINGVLVNHRRFVEAATYTAPTDNRRTVGNLMRYTLRTLRLYRELRPEIARRMAVAHEFLHSIQSPEPILADALQLTEYQSCQGGVWQSFVTFVRLQSFCIRHCDKLFHTPVKKNLVSRLRGAYFPISCSEYFRFLSKSYQRKQTLKNGK